MKTNSNPTILKRKRSKCNAPLPRKIGPRLLLLQLDINGYMRKRCKMQDFCERWLKKRCANFTTSLLAPVASYYMLWFCFHATIRWHAGLPICPEHAGPHACPHSIRLCFTLKAHVFIFHTRKTATFSHICLPLPKKNETNDQKKTNCAFGTLQKVWKD